MIKSQIDINIDNREIKKSSKALLCSSFIKTEKILKEKKKGKKLYEIPIIIESSLGGEKYSFKDFKNMKDLKTDNIYRANYRLIKFCTEN